MVIPQLGAFLVKEPDRKIIFSSLLTRDDGTLRSLLREQGISEVEVSGILDRIIFDVRFALDNNQPFILEGLGIFSADPDGGLLFVECEKKPEPDPAQEEPSHPIEEAAPETTPKTETIEPEPEPEPETIEPSKESDEISIFEPDPDLEGLSYGGNNKRSKRRSSPTRARRRIDWWLVIGIAALALAAGAILYGMLRDGAGSSSVPFSEEFFAE